MEAKQSDFPIALRQSPRLSPQSPPHLSNSTKVARLMASTMTIEMPPLDIPVEEPDNDQAHPPTHENCNARHRHDIPDNTISKVSTTSRVVDKAIAPFLARHIPDQYAPLGGQVSVAGNGQSNQNSKFCYRHRPDLKCRRTADEPSMELLQSDLESLTQADQQAISHVWSLFSAAPAKHRNLMLQGILTQCCFPQLSYLSGAVRDLIRIDFVSALPAELALKVLTYLDTTSLCKAAQVSRKWRDLADDDRVWHRMCEQHIDRKCTRCGWGLPLLERKRLRDWKRQQQLRGQGRGLNEWSPELTPLPEVAGGSFHNHENSLVLTRGTKRLAEETLKPASPEIAKRQCTNGAKAVNGGDVSYFNKSKSRPWKEVYRDRFKVGTNWKYGRYTLKTIKAHDNGVMCLQFDDHILATGSYDSTIKIWNIETGELIRTLEGHTSGIRALQFDDSKLISGSLDRTMRVWNWRTGECLSVLTGHTEGVISVNFDGGLVATGSIDKTIRVWDFGMKSVYHLEGHTDWVNSVKLDSPSRTILSASDDCTVKLWDLDLKKCIKTFRGHTGQVQQVLPLPAEYEPEEEVSDDDDEDSVSVASDATTSTSADIRSSFGPAFNSSCDAAMSRALPPRYMLTAALDSTVRLWDIHTGRCIKKFFGHLEGVWALAADSLRIVSGAEDKMVKVWDSRSGRCEKTFSGHMGAVSCIGLSDSRMVTGSEDCEVRIYSFGSGGEGETPAAHTAEV